MEDEGLTSREALQILVEECEQVIRKWKEKETERKTSHCPLRSSHNPCQFYLASLLISAILIAIGAVDLENEISYPLLVFAVLLLVYTLLLAFYLCRKKREKKNINVKKVEKIIVYLKNTKDNFGYSPFPEPLTEDMWGQFCVRNGHPANVPKILLVKGDLVLLRPGQVVPVSCITEEGTVYSAGSRVEMRLKTDTKTGASMQLQPVRATCTESLILDLLFKCLEREGKSSKLEELIFHVLHSWSERYILLPFILFILAAVTLRHFNASSESYYGTRFVFSIPALIVLPLLAPTVPLILEILRSWNNGTVSDSLGVAAEMSDKDLLDIFSRLTGVSVVDKKGILSSGNPCMDKVIVMKLNENSELVPETMGLSSEHESNGKWKLYFDDPSWEDSISSLRPLGLNLQLNSCLHNQKYFCFLDHLSVVSPQVPRTIVTANRRCMCQFPQLLGFDSGSCLQFLQSEPKTLGFYKRQPGEAPLHGLAKHRTPIEMAFCTVHSDVTTQHGHVSCQGTADVVLDACTHAWNGASVIPLSTRLARQVRDIYQRNSMTGYCLLLSYRPTDATVPESLANQFVEVPLARESTYDENVRVRSLSSENVSRESRRSTGLETANDVIEHILSGQILCGLVAMQYEALPQAVQLVESLDNNCIRFVYFSRENELRSRVFAEKLGLEAGWNCHISLAEPAEDRETERPLQDVFLSSVVDEIDGWNRPAELRKGLLSRSEAYLFEEPMERRVSPCRRQSVCSVKVGAMPNKAQLPTGVSRVRPHLDEVDNVPLLVGLFTDCDPEVNKEMLTIMQENSEVVLTVGSSLNINNVDIFIQSDLSVCVPPLVDPNCSYVYRPPGILAATDIAARILSTATDFELNHNQLLNIAATVTGSRHRLASIKTSLLFLLMASVQLSALLFMSTLAVLPLVFNTTQIFLVVFVQLPLLFLGTVWTPFIPKENVIRIAPKTNGKGPLWWSHAKTFCVQFLPTVFVLLATFFVSLADNATLLCAYSDVVCSFGDEIKLSTEEIRHLIGLHFILYLVTNSIAWVNPLLLFCWPPGNSLTSPPWLLCSSLVISIQIGYSYWSGVYLHRLVTIPHVALVISWMIIVELVNELCKMKNIRSFLREQRRTKLAFDTKLGMNSPY